MTTTQNAEFKKKFLEELHRYVTRRLKYTNSTEINPYLKGKEYSKPILMQLRLLRVIKKGYIESRIRRSPQLNDDVALVVKSFVPESVRLHSLRKKYTNEILKQGLQKKTVKQLQFILINIIATIDMGFLSKYHKWFKTVGIDVPATMDKKRIPSGILQKYKSTSVNKGSKVERIMAFYQRACDIIDRKEISRFYYNYQENGRRSLYIHPLKKMAISHREDLSHRVIKMLCILTIVTNTRQAM